MMKSTELAVRSRATAPQGGAVFCKSVGVLQAAVRNGLCLISEHRLRAPPGGPCLFWNAALVPTEGASAASDVAPARGTRCHRAWSRPRRASSESDAAG